MIGCRLKRIDLASRFRVVTEPGEDTAIARSARAQALAAWMLAMRREEQAAAAMNRTALCNPAAQN